MASAHSSIGNRYCFLHSDSAASAEASAQLSKLYGQYSVTDCDVVIALGGDGYLLSVLSMPETADKPVFGMNRGTVGFLLNPYDLNNLPERLAGAVSVTVHRLKARVTTTSNEVILAAAFNDVALFRSSGQAAHIAIRINGVLRLEELVCDGILLATPAGSTAYNLSAHGPILPLRSGLLAMTPISSFRPRRWPGALLDKTSKVKFDVLDWEKRPVVVTADSREIRNAQSVEIESDRRFSRKLLFESGSALEDRIIREQFVVM